MPKTNNRNIFRKFPEFFLFLEGNLKFPVFSQWHGNPVNKLTFNFNLRTMVCYSQLPTLTHHNDIEKKLNKQAAKIKTNSDKLTECH